MTCDQAAWRIVERLEQTQAHLSWALTGMAFLAGLLVLVAVRHQEHR